MSPLTMEKTMTNNNLEPANDSRLLGIIETRVYRNGRKRRLDHMSRRAYVYNCEEELANDDSNWLQDHVEQGGHDTRVCPLHTVDCPECLATAEAFINYNLEMRTVREVRWPLPDLDAVAEALNAWFVSGKLLGELPTWGPPPVNGKDDAYSWDETRVLGIDGEIVSRKDWEAEYEEDEENDVPTSAHITNFGISSHFAADLDGFLYSTPEAAASGRWDYGSESCAECWSDFDNLECPTCYDVLKEQAAKGRQAIQELTQHVAAQRTQGGQ